MSVHKKNSAPRFSSLADYRKHLYECLVLLYCNLYYVLPELVNLLTDFHEILIMTLSRMF